LKPGAFKRYGSTGFNSYSPTSASIFATATAAAALTQAVDGVGGVGGKLGSLLSGLAIFTTLFFIENTFN
jgi:hypothetical protein